jgi:murein DD-endopeptidase MepM/ murein hydrolase activator NlpD
MGPFAACTPVVLALVLLVGSAAAGPSEQHRIGRETTKTVSRSVRDNGRDDEVSQLRFRWPVRGPITSEFGPRRAFARFHSGIDIGVDPATPCRTPAAGTVILAGWRNGYGKTVVVDHGDEIHTLYGHLSSIAVRRGQRVEQGAVLGLTGTTGHASGPHLHYEILVNGRPIDPGPYLDGQVNAPHRIPRWSASTGSPSRETRPLPH